MSATIAPPTLDRLLEPVTECLTPEALKQLVDLPTNAHLQERLEILADRNTEGQLSLVEQEEYQTYVHAIQVISILQAKARKILANQSSR